MTKKELQQEVNGVVKQLSRLQNNLDNLYDDATIEAEGCTEEESEKAQNWRDDAGQLERALASVTEAINHLEWLERAKD